MISFRVLLRSPLPRSILRAASKPRAASLTRATSIRMETKSSNPGSGTEVGVKIQQLVAQDSRLGWEECWNDGLTPWDLGKPTPVISHLLEMGTLPTGRILVPGCGTGYDVVAMAGRERYVVGLEISETAVKRAEELSTSSENSDFFTFVAADFFNWHPSELFDVIFDYTFFCAIDPCLREKWASQIKDILKPEGELITLIFPIGDFEGGPPYAVSLSAYEDVLHPLGFKAVSVVDNELAIGPRAGREKLARWKRTIAQSPL